jgi:AcrR family transcriptional regulator
MIMHSELQERPAAGPTRAERRRTRTRAALLAAARRVFAERGFHDTSIADITAAADSGVGTFYLHFHDKDDVLRTLVQEGLDEVRARLAAAVGDTPRHLSLPRFLPLLLREAYTRRDLFAIALGSGTRPGLAARAALADYLENVLDDAARRGLLQGYDVPLLASLLSGMVAQSMVWWLDHSEPNPEDAAAQMLRLLREGLPSALVGDPEPQT